jgi:hypothetical protein
MAFARLECRLEFPDFLIYPFSNVRRREVRIAYRRLNVLVP